MMPNVPACAQGDILLHFFWKMVLFFGKNAFSSSEKRFFFIGNRFFLWLAKVIDDELDLGTAVEIGILAHVEVLKLLVEGRDVLDPASQSVDGDFLLAMGEIEHR